MVPTDSQQPHSNNLAEIPSGLKREDIETQWRLLQQRMQECDAKIATYAEAMNNISSERNQALTAKLAAEAAKTAAEAAKAAAESERNHAMTAKTAAEAAKTAAEVAKTVAEGERDHVSAAKKAAEVAKTAAETAKTTAEGERGQAVAAKTAAEAAKTAAESAKTAAEGERDHAAAAKTAAEAAKAAAEDAKTAAEGERDHATAAKSAAEVAKTAAESAKTAVEAERDEALKAKADAATARNEAAAAKTEAETARDHAIQAKTDSASELVKAHEAAERAAAEAENARRAHNMSTTVGLAGAFNQKAIDAKHRGWCWVIVLALSLSIAGWIGWVRYEDLRLLIEKSAGIEVLGMQLFLALIGIGAPVWLAWMATKIISRTFAITEDYAYKASLATAYVGFRDEAKGLDPLLEQRLLAATITQLDANPVRFIDSAHPGSPLQDLLQQPFMITALRDATFKDHLIDWVRSRFKLNTTNSPKAELSPSAPPQSKTQPPMPN